MNGVPGVATAQQFVGDYRMFHLIRMGAVYEIWAVRPISGTEAFAIKWLPPGRKHTSSAVAELRHEHNVGKDLQHPGVIKTYEFNTTSNGAYLRMELFKTPNLKQQLVNGASRLHWRLKEILIPAAGAIAHMHSKGWIHRDIKPDNFLVDDNNEVRLIDFTIAAKPSGTLSKLLGMRTKVQGTYSYMSPEQIRGQGPDPRADIYSFGCMMYELFSGKLPFTANSPQELLQKHIKSKPAQLTLLQRNVHPEAAALVHRMISKEPSERPSNMTEVMLAIKSLRLFLTPPAPPADDEPAPERPEL